MNERAIDLYKQAAEFAYKNVDKEFYDTTAFQGVIVGKFSELMVFDFLSQLTNDDSLGEARIATIKRLAERYGVAQ